MTEDPRARRLPWFAASWCPGPPPAPRRRSLSWVWAAPFPVPLRCRAAAEGKSRKPRCPSPCGPRDLPKVGAALQLMLAPGTRGGVELFWAVVSRAFSPGLCRASHAFQPWALRWEGGPGALDPGLPGGSALAQNRQRRALGGMVAGRSGKAYSELRSQHTGTCPGGGQAGSWALSVPVARARNTCGHLADLRGGLGQSPAGTVLLPPTQPHPACPGSPADRNLGVVGRK